MNLRRLGSALLAAVTLSSACSLAVLTNARPASADQDDHHRGYAQRRDHDDRRTWNNRSNSGRPSFGNTSYGYNRNRNNPYNYATYNGYTNGYWNNGYVNNGYTNNANWNHRRHTNNGNHNGWYNPNNPHYATTRYRHRDRDRR